MASAEPTWAEARVTSTLQFFQQSLAPGIPGAVNLYETSSPLTVGAWGRFGDAKVRFLDGTTSGEVSAWGRLGNLDGSIGDGDVTAAWAEYAGKRFRLRLGRQVVLPGAARYVRFDGASAGVHISDGLELNAYAGWVVLPRWSLPRGAYLLGFVTDALQDTRLMESQNRAGQVTWGGRLTSRFRLGNFGVAFHEQRDLAGVAFRAVSADAVVSPKAWMTLGGRVTFDTASLAVSEARVWGDLSTRILPVSIDYSFQSPVLLLPRTSILAAFGGSSWHELGAELTFKRLQSLNLSGCVAGQLYEGDRLGGRGSLKASWVPGIDRRGLLILELGRALVPASGFTFARAAARWHTVQGLWLSGDASIYVYDQPIRQTRQSLAGVLSVEYLLFSRLRGVVSGTAMSTPYSRFETQALAKLVFDWDSGNQRSSF